jgi:radical SAM superfamily enzyme YgiQ (UPF0313 family)
MVEIAASVLKEFPLARRICLVQLPVPDPNYSYARANVPIAAACLKGAVAGLGKELLLLPAELADRAGDETILRWLLSGGFDAVGFSLYLWNRERSAYLARRLKEESPGILCAAGGPEVQDDGEEAGLGCFDALIAGEGEEAFFSLLGGVGRYQSPFLQARTGERLADERAVALQPYLSGALEAGPETPVFLETMRGCPHDCAYCHYGRNSGPPRHVPLEAVEAVFRLASERGVKELYLMDPSLSARPRFEEFLRSVALWNRTGMRIHAEMPVEDATPERAALMARAGIMSVEAGLQSTNPAALKAVRRSWDRKKFEAGARSLADSGVSIQLGVIMGLPFDGLDEIAASLSYVADLGLSETAGAFPLAVLPGTELRSRSGEYRMKHMAEPPYFLLSSAWLSEADMREAARLPGEIWNRDQQEPVRPHFGAGAPSVEFLDLRRPSGLAVLSRPEGLAYSLTLLIGSREATDRNALLAAARGLRDAAPFTQYQLVWVAEPGALPDSADMDIVTAAFSRPDTIGARLRHFEDDSDLGSARSFFLARDLAQALRWAEGGMGEGGAELLLDLRGSRELVELAAEYDWETLPFLVVDAQARADESLREAYSGFANLMIGEGPSEER